MEYDLTEHIDQTIKADRIYVSAIDEEKLRIMDFFSTKINQKLKIGDLEYVVDGFSDMLGNIKIIHLKTEKTDLYIRPSGTGPDIKIYIYGHENFYLNNINNIENFIQDLKIE